MRKLSFQEYTRRFSYQFRSRVNYSYAFLPISLCREWMHGLGQAVLINRGAFERYLASNIFDSLISSLLESIWVFAAFQRVYSMGVPVWATAICTAAMTALGWWTFTTQTHQWLTFWMFLLAQLPLMIIKRRADRDTLELPEAPEQPQEACNPAKS